MESSLEEVKLDNIVLISEHRNFMQSLYDADSGDISLLVTKDDTHPADKIKVHKSLLVKVSSAFHLMLTTDCEESKTQTIDLRMHKQEVVENFKRYLYMEQNPGMKYYLSRPQLFFEAIQFCDQYLLNEYYGKMLYAQLETLLDALLKLVSCKCKQDEIHHYALFSQFEFELKSDWEPKRLIPQRSHTRKLDRQILKCMHFIVSNSHHINRHSMGEKLDSLMYKTCFGSLTRISTRAFDSERSSVFADIFFLKFQTEFQTWLNN